jgi:3,4-dihydroxy 2-butanone 4-phosphate synthase/GTP cyclohydrolase II
MARLPELREFADAHGLALISIEQLIEYRRRTERLVTRVAETSHPERLRPMAGLRLPLTTSTAPSTWRSCSATSSDGEDVLTRVHSECLTGDVFGSQRCDCGAQLDAAMAAIAGAAAASCSTCAGTRAAASACSAKLQAYELQDGGADTVDANLELGLPVDAREYSVAARRSSTDLGVRSVRLLTNNPAKVAA